MKKTVFFVAAILFAFLAGAQTFTIQSVDALSYPSVNVNINLTDKTEAAQGDFKVYENSAEVPFTFSKSEAAANGGLSVCFLIEASGYTYGTPVENFKKAVAEALDKGNSEYSYNVCYFGRANSDGKSLNVLSAEFTSDRNILKNEMKNKVVAARDTNRVADVFKSIYECLDFINSKNISGNKIIIVISAAINNSNSPIKAEDCIEKSNKYSIPVYTVTYKTGNRYAADNFVRISDKTNASSASAKSAAEISSVIAGFLESAAKNAAPAENGYIITFTSSQKGDSNRFEIAYKGEKQSAVFAKPGGGESFFAEFWWIFLAGGIAIIGIIVVVVLMSVSKKKKKAAEADKLRQAEEKNILLQEQLRTAAASDRTSIPVQQPQKYDLKKTVIGGGGGTPVLMVSAGGVQKNYPLNKARMSVGRTQGNDIVIPEATVSGNHAYLSNENGSWFVSDNNSTNGTYVNGTRINRQKLNNGDIIKMGNASIKIQF